MASAAALGPYSRASALACKAQELRLRGHDERSDDKLREALAAARAVGTEDCLVTAFLTVAVAERAFDELVRLSCERPMTPLDRLRVDEKLRALSAETIPGAAAVARRRRSAGAHQPAEQAWYLAFNAAAVREVNNCTESIAFESVKNVASLCFETTAFAACTALCIFRAAAKRGLFSVSELSSGLDAVIDLVDEAVALFGQLREEDYTVSGYEGLFRERVRDSAELWRQQTSTAAHAGRLKEALKQLDLISGKSADQHALSDQEVGEQRTKQAAARAAASAPELLRSCALASCGAKEAHKAHFSRCGACKTVVYCSKDCQLADWPAHKKACKAARKAAEAAKTTSAGNAA